MELTPGQVSAARDRGCTLTPATDDQVRRLAMQRRIFQVDGLPFVAARDGFFETHGTLAALIEGHRPAAATDGCPEAGVTPVPAQVGASDTERSAAVPGAFETAAAQQHHADAPSAKQRKARAPRPEQRSAPTDSAIAAAETAEVLKAEGTTAELGTAPTRAPRGRVAGRRAGEPPTPRWMTAGKERRGRLK